MFKLVGEIETTDEPNGKIIIFSCSPPTNEVPFQIWGKREVADGMRRVHGIYGQLVLPMRYEVRNLIHQINPKTGAALLIMILLQKELAKETLVVTYTPYSDIKTPPTTEPAPTSS